MAPTDPSILDFLSQRIYEQLVGYYNIGLREYSKDLQVLIRNIIFLIRHKIGVIHRSCIVDVILTSMKCDKNSVNKRIAIVVQDHNDKAHRLVDVNLIRVKPGHDIIESLEDEVNKQVDEILNDLGEPCRDHGFGVSDTDDK